MGKFSKGWCWMDVPHCTRDWWNLYVLRLELWSWTCPLPARRLKAKWASEPQQAVVTTRHVSTEHQWGQETRHWVPRSTWDAKAGKEPSCFFTLIFLWCSMVLLVIVDDYSMEMHDSPVFEKKQIQSHSKRTCEQLSKGTGRRRLRFAQDLNAGCRSPSFQIPASRGRKPMRKITRHVLHAFAAYYVQ